jgi:hypothetical protein
MFIKKQQFSRELSDIADRFDKDKWSIIEKISMLTNKPAADKVGITDTVKKELYVDLIDGELSLKNKLEEDLSQLYDEWMDDIENVYAKLPKSVINLSAQKTFDAAITYVEKSIENKIKQLHYEIHYLKVMIDQLGNDSRNINLKSTLLKIEKYQNKRWVIVIQLVCLVLFLIALFV